MKPLRSMTASKAGASLRIPAGRGRPRNTGKNEEGRGDPAYFIEMGYLVSQIDPQETFAITLPQRRVSEWSGHTGR
jgi:hypothetical protein